MKCQIANKKPKNSGFSLIELSVVLIIIGILIYMTLVATTAQLEQAKIKSTQDKLTKIQNALYVFYAINARLPCPADGTLANASGNGNFGKEQPSATTIDGSYNNVTCSGSILQDALPIVYAGVIPTRSLGLSDDTMMDSWGDRFTYVVSKFCVDPDNWTTAIGTASTNTYKCSNQSTIALNGSLGAANQDGDNIIIKGLNGQSWPINSPGLGSAAYIVISQGHDQLGAYPRMGGAKIMQSTAFSSNPPSELNNANLNALANTTYYDWPINNGDMLSTYFDDLTIWNTAAQIDYNANH